MKINLLYFDRMKLSTIDVSLVTQKKKVYVPVATTLPNPSHNFPH